MADKAKKRRLIGSLLPAAAILSINSCNVSEEQLTAKPAIEHDYDWFETKYALYNGIGISFIKPSGVMIEDFADFLFGQSGGRHNRDTRDIASKNPCPVPFINENGEEIYGIHTELDITWKLFTNPQIAKWVGYSPTPEVFYEMPDDVRLGIVDYHINFGRVTSSEVVNLVFAYSVWGGGGYRRTLDHFVEKYGNIEDNIANNGEYFVFSRMIECRRDMMERYNQHEVTYKNSNGKWITDTNWNINKHGWSSGLAHFYRVFKMYCKS
ncbi:MAG: hypothetical protein JXR36_04160 [Bacteroidales bacterium]|nr:hypothetical protein [Bacteroidales bacterium]